MPLHDYQCPACGAIIHDCYRPVSQKASDHPPICLNGHPLPVTMDWLPAVGAIDLQVQPFPVQIRQHDGSYKTVEVKSIKQMRDIERATEIAARNGEGEALRFRMYSNDRSNGDVNTFGDPRFAVGESGLSADAKKKWGRQGAFKAVDAPSGELGPGVTEDTASALVSE